MSAASAKLQPGSNPVDVRLGRRKARSTTQLTLVSLDGRTKEAARIRLHVERMTAGRSLSPQQAAMVQRAAELLVIAEDHRLKVITDLSADLNALVRVERMAAQAEKAALASLPRKSDTGQGLSAYLAQKATGSAA